MEPYAPPPWHRTKIVCTLGPATDPPGILERMIGAGMTVARINTSHGDHTLHARRIERVRQAALQADVQLAILVDLPGPKFRLGDLPDGSVELDAGDAAVLGSAGHPETTLPLRHPELLAALRVGDSVHLADGAVKLSVLSTHATGAVCEAVTGGTIRSGSGINVPDSVLPSVIPTDDDRRHIAFAVSQQAEWIGVSFVQTADDVSRVRALLPSEAAPLLIAKIEKRRALSELGAILEAADGVMVARGDLGVETNLAEIALVQKRIIALANSIGRPVITATQMLESMVEQELPTRAEVSDVTNAVLDGTDAVMLSAETAIGHSAVGAVRMLQRILVATEHARCAPAAPMTQAAKDRLEAELPDAVATDRLHMVSCQLASSLGAKAIVTTVHEIGAALGIARFRPHAPILAITDNALLCGQMALVRGAVPLLVLPLESEDCVRHAQSWLFAHGMARNNDAAVLVASSGAYLERADTLRVIRLRND